jgi:transposase
MLALIEQNPKIYLDEISEALEDQHDITASVSTVWMTLKQLGITNKKAQSVIHYEWLSLTKFQLSRVAAECSAEC